MLEVRTRKCGKVKDSVTNSAWRKTRVKSAWSYTLTGCEILDKFFVSGFFLIFKPGIIVAMPSSQHTRKCCLLARVTRGD